MTGITNWIRSDWKAGGYRQLILHDPYLIQKSYLIYWLCLLIVLY